MSRSASPRRRPRPRVLVGGLLLGATLVGGAGLTVSAVLQANEVRLELGSAAPELASLRTALGAGSPAALEDEALERLGRAAGRAVDRTSGVDWWFAERLPVLGANFEAVRTAAESADVVVHDVLEPVLTMPLDGLVVDGRLDTGAVSALARASAHGLEALEQQVGKLDRLDRSALLPQVSDALSTIDGPLREASALSATIAPVLRSLPAMLGEGGPRDVVVLFQNSAESRALGGIAGASVLIHIEDGGVAVTRTLSAADFVAHAEPVVPLPPDADAVYRSEGPARAGTTIHEVTARPDFPYGAQVASTLWQEAQGVEPDLILAVDPRALSYLLRATGPIALEDGSQVSTDTVVDQLLNRVYREHGALTDASNRAQDAYFTAVVQSLVTELQRGALDVPEAVGAWAQAVDERRLLAWSPDRVHERALIGAGVGGALPQTTSDEVPFGLYLADAVGSKLDYYLRQEVRLGAGSCDADGARAVSISSSFSNTIDEEAAVGEEEFDYITGFYEREGLARGEIRLRLMLYVPRGAEIASFRVDGVEVPYSLGSDSGRPVATALVTIPPGASVLLEADTLVRGAGAKSVSFDGTPGVFPTTVVDAIEPCGRPAPGA